MGNSLGSVGRVVSYVEDPLDILGYRAGADAQEGAANSQLKQQWADRAEVQGYAEATPQELANMQAAIKFSQNDIARKEKLLASVDPALIAAGKNALDLLNGKEAGVLAPLRDNLARQETKLREKLQAQYGSGYETTTAGQQALEQFNQQSNMTLAQAQQNSLGQLLGVVQNTAGQNSNLNTQMSLGQLLGSIQNRKINTLENSKVNPALGYAGQMAQSQLMPQYLNTASQIFGLASGMGGMGGTAPTPTPTPTPTLSSGSNLGVSLGGLIDTSQFGTYL